MIGFKQKIKRRHIMFCDEDKNTNILVSFLIGGIIGAGLALLFAPQSGRKTRKQIAEMADEVKDYATDYTKKLKEKVL
jgi:gas vesicle protein